jgi:hypothetical protein
MALIGNFTVLNKNLGRNIGQGVTAFAAGIGSDRTIVRSNWNLWQDWAKFSAQDRGAQTATPYYPAKPNGYYPPGSWGVTIKAGFIGSYQMLNGTGTVSPLNLAGGLNAVGPLTGAGNITAATAQLIVSAIANLTGSGDITNASLLAVLQAVATIIGSGDITAATRSALGWMTSALSGSGAVTPTPSATGTMAASITSSSVLSPESLAQALLDSNPIEPGYSMRQTLRLILSAEVAKLSNATGSPITIRDINDTVDRIVMAVDGAGNRTGGTYNVS